MVRTSFKLINDILISHYKVQILQDLYFCTLGDINGYDN